MSTKKILQLLGALLAVFYMYNLAALVFSGSKQSSADLSDLKRRIARLERYLRKSEDDISRLRAELSEESKRYENALLEASKEKEQKRNEGPIGEWEEPIPVIVFVCNRPRAIKNHLKKLLMYRPSAAKFPVIVSQDCDNSAVANVVKSFGPDVQYIKHVSGDKANITVLPGHERYVTYYRIARHYKLGLSFVFDKLSYSSAIITEDDLDIAPDFFSYFSATRRLLEEDKTIYCISAWNDNGKANLVDKDAVELLYRSDFFGGLGWMMTSDLWHELGPHWPNGFWDDWIRDPLRRKNRTCIRPEISRTGMTKEGQKGASKGMFFLKHLSMIMVNSRPVDFSSLNLRYLLKKNYDESFLNRVYSARKMKIGELLKVLSNRKNETSEYRVEYSELQQYLKIAEKLQIMRDFKAGVPRTAYFGVVTCFINNSRIFVAPNRDTWRYYDPKWEAPDNPADMLRGG